MLIKKTKKKITLIIPPRNTKRLMTVEQMKAKLKELWDNMEN